jgi:integrase
MVVLSNLGHLSSLKELSMPVYERKGRGERPKRYFFKFQWNKETVKKGVFKSQSEAAIAEREAIEKLKKLSSTSTFGLICAKRCEELQVYSTNSWYKDSRTILAQYQDWFKLPVCDITSSMVRERIIEVAKQKSNSIANKHLVVLKSCFNLAFRDGEIIRNPVNSVKKLPTESEPKYIPPKEDIEAIIALAEPLDAAYLTVIWLTAARIREINNLEWPNVDFDHRKIKVWTRKKKGGNKRYRTIGMTQKVYDALQYAWKHRVLGSPWVFTNLLMAKQHPTKPEKWRYDYRDKFIKTLCKRAGVQEFAYHNLRHQTASSLDDAGVPLAVIQSILGHENAITTARYLHDLGKADRGIEMLEEA